MIHTLYCSFCGKSQREVGKLIAGPTVFICDECVDMCHDIVHDGSTQPAQPITPPIPLEEWTGLLHTAEMALSTLQLAFSTARRAQYEQKSKELGEVIGFGEALADKPPGDDA